MTMPVSVKKKDGGKIPGPANVPNTIEIRAQVQLPNTKLSFWTVHGSYTTAPLNMQSLANALFTAISGAWGTNLAPLMPPGTLFQNVAVRDMTSFLNPVSIGTGTAIPGTSASVAMPESNAIALTENIAQRGKGMKGRIFIGGWATNADATGGSITPATQTALNTFGTALFNAISAQSLVPCVAQVARAQYQGLTGTIHPARAANHVNVTSYVCRDLVWDTQRRRVQL